MTSRALVLGGGGPVGVAWEAGLVAALDEAGVDVAAADLIVGTSAGSIVGAMLASGRAPREIYDIQLEPPERERRPTEGVDLSGLVERIIKLYTSDAPRSELLAEIGSFALGARTMSEEEWVEGFVNAAGEGDDGWPPRFKCTAIDTADGTFTVWDGESGAPLHLAVASSCAVPGVFPPVTIGGRRYMDGGLGSTTNSQLASGYERVIVVYVTAGTAAQGSPIGGARRERFEREIAALRESGSDVAVVTPDDEFNRRIGLEYMNSAKRLEAAELGYRQGAGEAARLRTP